MRYIIAFILPTVLCAKLYSQSGRYFDNSPYYLNHRPQNPESSSLGSFGSIPINYYTGLPEVKFKLMVLKGRSYQLPVSLNYDATGIRTDEMSGPVGLKWQLNAGGFVQRQIQGGFPDEHSLGYWRFAAETDYFRNINAKDWAQWSEKNERDSQPDEFTIQIPGRSITFVFDKYKNPVPIPRQNVQVRTTMVSGRIHKFELVTEDGTKYIFGGTTNAIQERKIENFTYSFKIDYKYALSEGGVERPMWDGAETKYSKETTSKIKTIDFYNFKWFLTAIITPDRETISFTYSKGTNLVYTTRPAMVRVGPELAPQRLYDYKYVDTRYCCTLCATMCDYEFPDPFNDIPAIRRFRKSNPGSPPCILPSSDCAVEYGFLNYLRPDRHFATPGSTNVNHTLITESNIRLVGISSETGSLSLISSPRTDLLNAQKYHRLDLYQAGALVKSIQLNYKEVNANENNDSFWMSEAHMISNRSNFSGGPTIWAPYIKNNFSSSPTTDAILTKYVYEGMRDYNYKRLFLESVEDVTDPTGRIPLYEFIYKGRELLKRRTSTNHDVHGFQGDFIPYGYYQLEGGFSAATANMFRIHFPNSACPDCGVLNEIRYPTGAQTIFTYKPSGIVNAGFKLIRIQDFDENKNVAFEREIEYISGAANSSPVTRSFDDFNIWETEDWAKYYISSSYNQNDESVYTHGSLEGNKEVRVYHGTKENNIGYEQYIYQSPVDAEYRDIPTVITSIPPENNYDDSPLKGIFPFPPSQNRDYLRGLLLSHKVFAKGSPTPVKDITYKYATNPNGYSPKVVKGLKGGSFQYATSSSSSFWKGYQTNAEMRYRYAVYNYTSDWVVLKETAELIRDQNDPAKVFTKRTTYEYDPVNLQQAQTRVSQTSVPDDVVTATKYVTHPDYALSRNNTSDPQSIAITQLLENGQFDVPIETQSWVQRPGYAKIISAVVHKYVRIPNSVIVKPGETWALKKGLPSSYVSSHSDQTGAFKLDETNMRRVHTFEEYLSNGNIVRQTTLDGIVSTYGWDQKGVRVISQTINPGPSEQTTSFTYPPGDHGPESVTDPNGIKKSFGYDMRGRLMIERNHDGNIIKRYRYHYASEDEFFEARISAITGQRMAGSTLNFQTPANSKEHGRTTYQWDFGNGDVKKGTTNNVNYAYALPGTYTVTLTISNPEYGSSSASLKLLIHTEIGLSICVKGPYTIDLCGLLQPAAGDCTTGPIDSNSDSILRAMGTGGCSALTFTWQMENGIDNWITFATGQEVGPPAGFVNRIAGNYPVRCIVSDNCGNSMPSEIILMSIFKSSNCY
jgi:hypothetical protein